MATKKENERLAKVEQKINNNNDRLKTLERKLDKMNNQLLTLPEELQRTFVTRIEFSAVKWAIALLTAGLALIEVFRRI